MGRHIQDGTGIVISVADDKDNRYSSGWKPYSGEPAKPKSETPDKTWKVDELKAYAAEHSIDLGDATKKDDIIAVLTSSGD
jgi:hypothetical protein